LEEENLEEQKCKFGTQQCGRIPGTTSSKKIKLYQTKQKEVSNYG